MLPRVTIEVSGRTMLTLLQHLAHRQFDVHPCHVIDMAIDRWLKEETETARQPSDIQGYHWKRLFLPAGTRLRIRTRNHIFHAEVVGDELLYNGHAVSPNQFAAACAGAPRNAWQGIMVLMPGERLWRPADYYRRELARKARVEQQIEGDLADALKAHPPGKRERRGDERRIGSRTLQDGYEGASIDD